MFGELFNYLIDFFIEKKVKENGKNQAINKFVYLVGRSFYEHSANRLL